MKRKPFSLKAPKVRSDATRRSPPRPISRDGLRPRSRRSSVTVACPKVRVSGRGAPVALKQISVDIRMSSFRAHLVKQDLNCCGCNFGDRRNDAVGTATTRINIRFAACHKCSIKDGTGPFSAARCSPVTTRTPQTFDHHPISPAGVAPRLRFQPGGAGAKGGDKVLSRPHTFHPPTGDACGQTPGLSEDGRRISASSLR